MVHQKDSHQSSPVVHLPQSRGMDLRVAVLLSLADDDCQGTHKCRQVQRIASSCPPPLYQPQRGQTSQPRATPWVSVPQHSKPCKGETTHHAMPLSRPYRPGTIANAYPGRCPGLACGRPLAWDALETLAHALTMPPNVLMIFSAAPSNWRIRSRVTLGSS